MSYKSVYEEWKKNPTEFWKNQSKEISWYEPADKILDDSRKPFYNWFTGGSINACYNCVDRHIENGRGEDIAIIYDSAMCEKVRKISYLELRKDVAKLAGALKEKGIKKITYSDAEIRAFRNKVAGPAAQAWIAENSKRGLPARELYTLVTGMVGK